MLEGSPAVGHQRGGRPRAAAAVRGELIELAVALALPLAACDVGHHEDRSPTVGSPVILVASNVAEGQSIPVTTADGQSPSTVELAFDQLLLTSSVTRQTFVMTDLAGNDLTPTIAYDPVARVVSLTPLSPLTPAQTYRVTIVTPQSPTDTNGLRSIGNTTLGPGGLLPVGSPPSLTFLAVAGDQPLPAGAHSVDFCDDILPVLAGSCGTGSCHAGDLPAAGLALNSPSSILATAIGRTAEGANTGPVASPPSPPTAGFPFGVDMPIVDPGPGGLASGNPGDSWLIYKLLLAEPSACTADGTSAGAPRGQDQDVDAGDCDGSIPSSAPATYAVPWQPLGDDARLNMLGNLVQGSAMPYPPATALTVSQMEDISLWIAAGAPVPASCP